MTKHNVTPPYDTMAESKHQVAEDDSPLSGMGKT